MLVGYVLIADFENVILVLMFYILLFLCGFIVNFGKVSGFVNNHKMAVRDHLRVPKFWRI